MASESNRRTPNQKGDQHQKVGKHSKADQHLKADQHSPRPSDLHQQAEAPRPSNRPSQQQLRHPSNRTGPETGSTPPQLTISDGPAPTRIRAANAYNIGDTIPMRYGITGGHVTRVLCTVQRPDRTQVAIDANHGIAAYRARHSGQHWYAFDAYNQHDERVASAEAIFVVIPQQIPR